MPFVVESLLESLGEEEGVDENRPGRELAFSPTQGSCDGDVTESWQQVGSVANARVEDSGHLGEGMGDNIGTTSDMKGVGEDLFELDGKARQ